MCQWVDSLINASIAAKAPALDPRFTALQVLLYAQKESVEPDAIQQLVHLAESPLPVSVTPLLLVTR